MRGSRRSRATFTTDSNPLAWSRNKATSLSLNTCQSVSFFVFLKAIAANKAGVVIPEALPVKDEIKREVGLYNMTRENVMQGMKFLI